MVFAGFYVMRSYNSPLRIVRRPMAVFPRELHFVVLHFTVLRFAVRHMFLLLDGWRGVWPAISHVMIT